MMADTQVAVIGGGPGGYVAALRLAQLGRKVTLIDEAPRLGGICLNAGCIPSKALIHAASLFHDARNAEAIGITARADIDLAKTQAWKESVLERLARGIAFLLKQSKVEVLHGKAQFAGSAALQVGDSDIAFKNAIIATGSSPIELPGLRFDARRVLNSSDVLALEEIPESLAVVGGGAIGLELGTVFAKLGSKVSVIEMMDQLLPGVDPELVRVIQRRLEKLGVKVLLGAKAEGLTAKGLKTSGGEVEAEKVLVAVGRKPNTAGLGLENTKVALDRKGFIVIDWQCRTADKSIFAIGDVTGPPMLAHRASAQARVAAEVIAGRDASMKARHVPHVAYTDPEVASVGAAEGAKTARFPFSALGRAHTLGETDGIVKVVADENGRVLGVHIVGAGASEMIAEACLALEKSATAEDIARTVHPHPSLSEGLMEAAWAALTGGKG